MRRNKLRKMEYKIKKRKEVKARVENNIGNDFLWAEAMRRISKNVKHNHSCDNRDSRFYTI